jgi:hypothetical protein
MDAFSELVRAAFERFGSLLSVVATAGAAFLAVVGIMMVAFRLRSRDVRRLGAAAQTNQWLVLLRPVLDRLAYVASVTARPAHRVWVRSKLEQATLKVAAALRSLPVEDPNLGKGLWIGQEFFGINQELSFPFGIGTIIDGKMQPIVKEPAATGK